MSDEQCGADPFENGYDQKLSEKEYRERIKYLMRCHDDSADEIERLRASEARLREALRRVRTAIVEADPSILICTLWMPDTMSETVVDHIDAALEEEKKG
jgi:hypothetical protein